MEKGKRVIVVGLALAALTAVAAYFGRNPPSVWVVNPFDRPLVVHAEDQRVEVAPHSQVLLGLQHGRVTVEIATADGTPVDSISASFDTDDIVNPLGAAPLRRETRYWTRDGTRAVGSTVEEPVDLCGERHVSAADAEDVLRTPKIVTFERGDKKGQRRIGIDFDREAPATACLDSLRNKQRPADADAIERFAR